MPNSEPSIERQLADAAVAIGVSLDEHQMSLFSDYYRTICIWNEKINLVSIKSSLDIPIKHFIDSLSAIPFITNTSVRLLDIGSGAGFPGIPLKIAVPSMQVTLLEASRKRSSFLKQVIRILALENIEVWNRRVETCLETGWHPHDFDVVISRATFKLPELITFAGHFLDDQGILIAMKGPDIRQELLSAAQAGIRAHLDYLSCHDLHLPVTGDPRKMVIYKKRL